MSILKDVKERYSAGANNFEPTLCCAVNYDKKFLEIIPKEVIERDYGCGDPSKYVKKGETVLDLGSGGGKICFIASQIVGEKGKVIGVDMTDDMLKLSRFAQKEFIKKVGYDNIEFKHGYIQDLKVDLDKLDKIVEEKPVKSAIDYKELNEKIEKLKKELPMIADNSIDVIVSNCVLNLVSDDLKKDLFSEMYRVLKIGGRIAISDIVSDEFSPKSLKDNANLWSGCLTGALQEKEFINELENAGFYGIKIDKYDEKPWHIVEGIEFRSATILAYKGLEGECLEKNQAVIYKGPFSEISDDDGHIYFRGERMAVCEKTFNLLKKEPYENNFIFVEPILKVEKKINFNCANESPIRTPKETKKGVIREDTYGDENCCGDNSCC